MSEDHGLDQQKCDQSCFDAGSCEGRGPGAGGASAAAVHRQWGHGCLGGCGEAGSGPLGVSAPSASDDEWIDVRPRWPLTDRCRQSP